MTRRRDIEAEEDMARLRKELGTEDPIISTPADRRGNGRKWAWDTLGKALGTVLAAILLGLAAFVATGRAYTIYGLPPRVDALEVKVYAPAQPMSQAEVDRLAAAIVAALPSPAPKKAK